MGKSYQQQMAGNNGMAAAAAAAGQLSNEGISRITGEVLTLIWL
jgi:hypothetical protein